MAARVPSAARGCSRRSATPGGQRVNARRGLGRRLAGAAPLVLAIAALSVVAGACDGGADDAGAAAAALAAAAAGGTAAPLSGKLTVFAAASLGDAFRALGTAFTAAHPGTTVEFNFASSSALATQIEQAAPADVFASADGAQVQRLAGQALLAGQAAAFARNRPVIVVPAENRARIAAPRDLANAGVKLVLAAPDVPIGSYARQVIERLAADPAYGATFRGAALRNVISNEPNVRAVLTKVELGEADAGIVYRTDALLSQEKVRVVTISDAANVTATYPIAAVRAARHGDAAAAFIAFVLGVEGQHILAAYGFDAAQ
ncbi:MAG: molybdate ABC transporter substrate-binding protein [Dehalococcoidia bacterium]|nr:molybdate ABC transporter substrate-binding protein [Dehalococcoidia bacterium]